MSAKKNLEALGYFLIVELMPKGRIVKSISQKLSRSTVAGTGEFEPLRKAIMSALDDGATHQTEVLARDLLVNGIALEVKEVQMVLNRLLQDGMIRRPERGHVCRSTLATTRLKSLAPPPAITRPKGLTGERRPFMPRSNKARLAPALAGADQFAYTVDLRSTILAALADGESWTLNGLKKKALADRTVRSHGAVAQCVDDLVMDGEVLREGSGRLILAAAKSEGWQPPASNTKDDGSAPSPLLSASTGPTNAVLALLALGPAPLRIIHSATGLNRLSKTRTLLLGLRAKGLVVEVTTQVTKSLSPWQLSTNRQVAVQAYLDALIAAHPDEHARIVKAIGAPARRASAQMRTALSGTLSQSEVQILKAISQPTELNNIADQVGLSSRALGRTLNILVANGYAKRLPNKRWSNGRQYVRATSPDQTQGPSAAPASPPLHVEQPAPSPTAAASPRPATTAAQNHAAAAPSSSKKGPSNRAASSWWTRDR